MTDTRKPLSHQLGAAAWLRAGHTNAKPRGRQALFEPLCSAPVLECEIETACGACGHHVCSCARVPQMTANRAEAARQLASLPVAPETEVRAEALPVGWRELPRAEWSRDLLKEHGSHETKRVFDRVDGYRVIETACLGRPAWSYGASPNPCWGLYTGCKSIADGMTLIDKAHPFASITPAGPKRAFELNVACELCGASTHTTGYHLPPGWREEEPGAPRKKGYRFYRKGDAGCVYNLKPDGDEWLWVASIDDGREARFSTAALAISYVDSELAKGGA